MHTGPPLLVHDAHACAGQHCCVHNSSDHPLRTAPLVWKDALRSMWRRCPHGEDHPDPDDLEFQRWTRLPLFFEAMASVHLGRCDGCCREGRPE